MILKIILFFFWFVYTKLKFLNEVIIHHLSWKNLTSQEMRTVEILRRDKQVHAIDIIFKK